jgi:formate--tetrahydrofolate ligase
MTAGAFAAHESRLYTEGGKGGEDLARALVAAADEPSTFRFLYPLEASLRDKIATLATKVYGAGSVEYSPAASEKIATYEAHGYGRFPVCMAKTQSSLSHDPKLKGRPSGFTFPIRDVRVAVGAGFVYPLAGEIMTMPGLGRHPGGAEIDLDEAGNIVGMF